MWLGQHGRAWTPGFAAGPWHCLRCACGPVARTAALMMQVIARTSAIGLQSAKRPPRRYAAVRGDTTVMPFRLHYR